MPEGPLRVLLVDDDQDEYIIIGDLLRPAEEQHFELTWVSTYEEGLKAILSSRFEVCLVDYRLGEQNGLDLLSEVTAHSSYPPVILLTGQGDREVDVTATKSGAADYLLKGELTSALLERAIRYAAERGRTLAALRQATAAAEAANRSKSEFLAVMSHEIRTPLNAILGLSEVLAESQLQAPEKQYVQVLRRAGENLLALINDILDLSKIEAGQLKLERIEFNLHDVLDHAIELVRVKARSKDLVLLSRVAPDVPYSLVGDRTRLQQILINLLGNAVKFSESGEVLLTVGKHPSGKLGEIEFSVSDYGIGIASDKLETIFESFSQADSSISRKYGGTGLGLRISRRLAEQMGGTLTVSSKLGEGSTFRFNAQFHVFGARSPQQSQEAGQFKGYRCLVIHRDASDRERLVRTLATWGLASQDFGSPDPALKTLAAATALRHSFSLALVDQRGTESENRQIVKAIERIDPNLPVIVFTDEGSLYQLVEGALKRRRSGEDAGQSAGNTTRPVRSLRLMIAEDSPDNRLLIQLFLKDSTDHLLFVEDGCAAVERFSREGFDLILMDLHMPVMDGLTATRAIRALERERGPDRTPVIALTASARPEDVVTSQEAGCDRHLCKPISKRDLLRVIEEYRRQPHSAAVRRVEPLSPKLRALAQRYLDNRSRDLLRLQEALEVEDFQTIRTIGHNMKGSGSGYGFQQLTSIGKRLESAADEQAYAEISVQISALASYLSDASLEGALQTPADSQVRTLVAGRS